MAQTSNVFSTPTIGKRRPSDANTVGFVGNATLTTPNTVEGLSVEEFGGEGQVRKTVITLEAYSELLTRTSAVIGANSGAGSPGLLYTFPIGAIQVLGVVVNLTVASSIATLTLLASIGTTQATSANATLTTTEADLIASTAATVATGAGSFVAIPTATYIGVLDGTATAKTVFLNNAVAVEDIVSNTAMVWTGYVTITWVHMGDK